MRVAREGWVVLAPMAAVCVGAPAAALIWAGWPAWIGWGLLAVGTLLTLWGVWFFRDPLRTPPVGARLVISPADGHVVKIDEAHVPPELAGAWPEAAAGGVGAGKPVQRIAIFLNLFNVHVNRTPIAGEIAATAYVPGRFFAASLDKASELNERAGAVVTDERGRRVAFVQIAGLVARRIVNHLKVGQRVHAGERFGLIRFGSRAEVYVPPGTALRVRVGDFVRAGESVLAELPE